MRNCLHIVFIINGHNGAGKDEFVNQFKKASEDDGNRYVISNISTIDPIKRMLTQPFLWDGKTKDDAARSLLHDVKELVDAYSDFTNKTTIHRLETFRMQNANVRTVSFVHCREPWKIDALVKRLNKSYNDKYLVGTILVRRDSDDIASNDADQYVESYKYDIVIDNNFTIEDLYDKAKNIVSLCDQLIETE